MAAFMDTTQRSGNEPDVTQSELSARAAEGRSGATVGGLATEHPRNHQVSSAHRSERAEPTAFRPPNDGACKRDASLKSQTIAVGYRSDPLPETAIQVLQATRIWFDAQKAERAATPPHRGAGESPPLGSVEGNVVDLAEYRRARA